MDFDYTESKFITVSEMTKEVVLPEHKTQLKLFDRKFKKKTLVNIIYIVVFMYLWCIFLTFFESLPLENAEVTSILPSNITAYLIRILTVANIKKLGVVIALINLIIQFRNFGAIRKIQYATINGVYDRVKRYCDSDSVNDTRIFYYASVCFKDGFLNLYYVNLTHKQFENLKEGEDVIVISYDNKKAYLMELT